MGTKATVYKVDLTISDIDRQYYATHNLVLAQHPSEPDRRLMARILAFAMLAEERLEFGKGLSTENEPDMWRRDLTGRIEQWVEMGQPDESSIRKACGLADEVVVVTYSGNSAEVWWSKNSNVFSRLKNLKVLDIDSVSLDAVTQLIDRRMAISVTVQDGEFQFSNGSETVLVGWTVNQN